MDDGATIPVAGSYAKPAGAGDAARASSTTRTSPATAVVPNVRMVPLRRPDSLKSGGPAADGPSCQPARRLSRRSGGRRVRLSCPPYRGRYHAPTIPGGRPMAKTTCPITRPQFRETAKAVEVTINGAPMLADPREFSTGSLGWYLNGKTVVDVNGQKVTVQVG